MRLICWRLILKLVIYKWSIFKRHVFRYCLDYMRVIKAISEDVLLENSGTCVVDRSYNVLKSPCYGVCTAPTMPYQWQMISLQFNSILCGRAIVRQSCHKLLGMCIQVTFLCSNAFRRHTIVPHVVGTCIQFYLLCGRAFRLQRCHNSPLHGNLICWGITYGEQHYHQ